MCACLCGCVCVGVGILGGRLFCNRQRMEWQTETFQQWSSTVGSLLHYKGLNLLSAKIPVLDKRRPRYTQYTQNTVYTVYTVYTGPDRNNLTIKYLTYLECQVLFFFFFKCVTPHTDAETITYIHLYYCRSNFHVMNAFCERDFKIKYKRPWGWQKLRLNKLNSNHKVYK